MNAAEARMRRTLAANPQFAAARLELSRVLQAQNKHDEVVGTLAPLLAPGGGADPDQMRDARALSGASQLALGQEALRAGKPQSALDLLQRSAELAPSPAADAALGAALAQLRRHDEAVSRLEKALEGGGTPDAATFEALADSYLGQSKEQDARKALQRAIAARPKDVHLYTRLAGMLLKARETESAASVLGSYLDQDPTNAEIHVLLLGLLEGRRYAARRAAVIERWRAADPGSEEACLRQADERVALKDTKGAAAALRQCLSTARSPDKLYAKMVDVLNGDGRKGASAPVHDFLDEEMRAHPDRAVLVDLKAQQYVRERKVKEAAALLDKAIADRPAEAAPYLAKARFYESIKKADQVPALIAAARERAPQSREPVRYALGFHVRQKQFDAIEGDLTLMKQLGASDEDVEALREQSTFTRAELSCVSVGQGPAAAALGQVIRSNDVHPHQGFWSGDAVQRGYVVNGCRRVTVDAVVDVTFNMREVTQLFIFVQARRTSASQTFHFKGLKPNEARPFSASTRLNALELGSSPMGTLGGIGSATQVTGVSVRVRVLSPTL